MKKEKQPTRKKYNYDKQINLAQKTGFLSDMDAFGYYHADNKTWAINHLLESVLKEYEVKCKMLDHYLQMLRDEKNVAKEDYCKVEAKGIPHPLTLRSKLARDTY